jgi:hypothetical protein
MIQLNYHIQLKFVEKAKEINQSGTQLNSKKLKKKLK